MVSESKTAFEAVRQMMICNGVVVSTLILAMDEAGMLSKRTVAERLLEVRNSQCQKPDMSLAAALLTAIVDKVGEGALDTSPAAAKFRRVGGMN
ncbi:MAG: hypothetical protein AB1450_11520 [Pseudomonadota bacterium]